ncbi:MAG: AbrB/MazE/SpoVT family DNA-binding domain-containing protein [Sphingomonadaceae bacterium]
MIHSRITSKAQTTIPRAVREALHLEVGDDVAYEIDGDRVILTRATSPDPFIANLSTFSEWSDETDSAFDILETLFPRPGNRAS